jgi:hypothetical protein
MYICNFEEIKIFVKLDTLMPTPVLNTAVDSKKLRAVYLAKNFSCTKENKR